jgi:hypothetical protein
MQPAAAGYPRTNTDPTAGSHLLRRQRRKGGNGRCFGIEGLEDRQQPRELQQPANVAADVKQFQSAATAGDGRVRPQHRAQRRAVDRRDVADIDDRLCLT